MGIPFADIALALQGPRGSGRTHRMLTTAPKGAIVLVASQEQARWMREAAQKLDREDLQFHVPRDHSLKGARGEFVADHHAMERWLFAAEAAIQEQIDHGRELLARLERAESEAKALREKVSGP